MLSKGRVGEMVDFANSWAGALQRIEQSAWQAWTQEPLILMGLALMALLAAIQAVLLRRTLKRLRDVNSDLTRSRDELTEIRGKYEREVHWRKAIEKVTQKGLTPEQVPAGKETTLS